ncbi:FecR domain-containing protein [Achromobacter aloeverae]
MPAAAESGSRTISQAEPPIPAAVARRAVAWWVVLQDDAGAPGTRDAWLRWRAAHPDHERAWQRIESVNGRLHEMSSPIKSAIAHATLTQPNSRGRRQAVKGLALLVFAGGGAWVVQAHTPWRLWTADYRTARGERRTVMLADGTEVVLNTDSAIDVSFDQARRRVRLIAGEILVTTAPDIGPAHRPFMVETAQGQARALGTRYAVRLLDGATDVAVFEGAVEVRLNDDPGQARVVHAGQQTAFTSMRIDAPGPVEDSSAAWAEGLIVARGLALVDFLRDLNRYSAVTLDCDPAVARLRVSGSYPLNDIRSVMDSVASTLGLRVRHERRFWGRERLRLEPSSPVRRDS